MDWSWSSCPSSQKDHRSLFPRIEHKCRHQDEWTCPCRANAISFRSAHQWTSSHARPANSQSWCSIPIEAALRANPFLISKSWVSDLVQRVWRCFCRSHFESLRLCIAQFSPKEFRHRVTSSLTIAALQCSYSHWLCCPSWRCLFQLSRSESTHQLKTRRDRRQSPFHYSPSHKTILHHQQLECLSFEYHHLRYCLERKDWGNLQEQVGVLVLKQLPYSTEQWSRRFFSWDFRLQFDPQGLDPATRCLRGHALWQLVFQGAFSFDY